MLMIKVRKDLCCGTRLCIKAAPGVFRLDTEGYNKSDGQPVAQGKEDLARKGAAVCPESAIELVEASDR
ncbi:MAG TPA: ferredoxin [Burkholderiales bacterium]|jgi:ferredoxin|nr:ferredoxin [Burkholderiales bacterium]